MPDDYDLALAINAALKGYFGAKGQSGHICESADGVSFEVDQGCGWESLQRSVVESLAGTVQDGDVVVIADKVVALALDRVGPVELLSDPDPKTVPSEQLEALALRWDGLLPFPVSPIHLLLADQHGSDFSTLGTDDPNARAGELAKFVLERVGVRVDCVISDTDTGLDTRAPLIGMVTFVATPIGATAGVNLYEAMRCAAAAEFVRGHTRRVPVVVCRPAKRRRERGGIGLPRHYTGILNRAREESVAHA